MALGFRSGYLFRQRIEVLICYMIVEVVENMAQCTKDLSLSFSIANVDNFHDSDNSNDYIIRTSSYHDFK